VSLLQRLTDLRLRALHHGLRGLPTPVASGLGARLGRLSVPVLHPKMRDRALANVARLRPELDAGGRARVVVQASAAVGRLFAEFSRLDRLWAEGRIEECDQQHLTALARARAPVICAAVHTGNWEVATPATHAAGLRLAATYLPPRNPMEHDLVRRLRGDLGVRLLRPGLESAIESLRILEAREEILGMFMDFPLAGWLPAPHLGRAPVARGNMAMAIRLALRTGAEIVPLLTERVPGPRYRITYLPPLALIRRGGSERELVAANLPTVNAPFEAWLRPRLEQWYMLFRFSYDAAPPRQG